MVVAAFSGSTTITKVTELLINIYPDMSTLKAKEVIKEKGMTIEEVASKIGITKGSLSAALSGNPTVSYLTRVADAIDCDIRDLFR